MDWSDTILRVIEFRTFSNIWFWLAVAVSWGVASNWLIGVPFDMLFRARKGTGQEVADLEAIVDVNVRRFTYLMDLAGLWILGLVAFSLSGLLMAGFFYGFELAKGLFVLSAPLTLIGFLNIRLAYQLLEEPLAGADLVQRLLRLRIWTQVIGMVAIFLTAMYGMYFNLHRLFGI